MNKQKYSLDSIVEWKNKVKAGDALLINGTLYIARDAAHKRLITAIECGEKLPFDLHNATIYYCGPTPNSENAPIGACGPTTSARMDTYTPTLLANGVLCTIGKGDRSEMVYSEIKKHRAIYLVAVGGCGALYANCVVSSEEIAYSDLGCESIKRLVVKDFPVYVAIDSCGNSIFTK